MREGLKDVAASRWTRVACGALLGSLLAGIFAFSVQRPVPLPLGLIVPGSEGPSVEVIEEDFPQYRGALPDDIGHDGQQFYAIARQPFSFESVAAHLDRPRYRLQRSLLGWLAGAIQPGGEGFPLLWSLVGVGWVSVFLLGLASGSLVLALGGRGAPGIAFAVPLLPGSWLTLMISTAENLALAASLGAVFFFLRRSLAPAMALAIAAVLAKEVALLVIVGAAVHRWRQPSAWAFAAVPSGVMGALYLYLHALFPGTETHSVFALPPGPNWVALAAGWISGEDTWLAPVFVVSSIGIGTIGMIRGLPDHPLAPALVLQIGLVAFLLPVTLYGIANGPRNTLAVCVLGLIVLLSTTRSSRSVSGA